ncbi:unnamed protein product [Sphagnum tenellum]
MNSLLKVTEISPTLKEILKMLDDPYRAAVEDEAYSGSPGRCETDFPWQENHGPFSAEDGDEISTIDSHSGFNDYEEGRGSLEGFQDDVNSTPQMGSWSEVTPDLDDFVGDLGDGEVEDSKVGDIMRHGSVEWLTASFGQSTQANAWAGPDHWKYHKPRDKARPKGHCAEDYDMDFANDERAPLSDGCWPEENDHGELDNLFENDLINAPPKGEEFSQDEGGISFQDLLDCLPEDCPAAAQEDISVHICFLCLLHLANEHNLCIKDCSTMDELRIFQVDKHAALASDVGDG